MRRILVAQTAHGQPVRELLAEAEARRVPVEFVPRARLDAAAPHHQGVLAEVEPFAYTPFERLLHQLRGARYAPLVLALDHVQDPQNLGALLRTACALGASGAILPERRAAEITPAAAKASAGAVEHLPIARVTNLVRALEDLKELGLWVVGLDARADEPLWEVDLTGPTVLVVGSEGEGLSRLVREHCDFVARVPMTGPMESLNVTVAGSLALYEALRQRVHST